MCPQSWCIIGVCMFTIAQAEARQSPGATPPGNQETDDEGYGSVIDPDLPAFQFSRVGGRWVNKAGASIRLLHAEMFGANTQFTLEPFVEIHDFSSGKDFSWELWRGSVGMTIQWRFDTRIAVPGFREARANIGIGYFHESDHASSIDFTRVFTTYSSFDEFPNGNFGSFEYVRLQSGMTHIGEGQWMLSWEPFVKIFPTPIERGAGRELRNSYGIDVCVRKMLSNSFSVYAGGYYESFQTAFVASRAGFRPDFNEGALIYRTMELGITQQTERFRIIPYIAFTNSNGRGLDFLNIYTEVGYGVRIVL